MTYPKLLFILCNVQTNRTPQGVSLCACSSSHTRICSHTHTHTHTHTYAHTHTCTHTHTHTHTCTHTHTFFSPEEELNAKKNHAVLFIGVFDGQNYLLDINDKGSYHPGKGNEYLVVCTEDAIKVSYIKG